MTRPVLHAIYITLIAALVISNVHFWRKTSELGKSLSLIQNRIEETKKELTKERSMRKKAADEMKQVLKAPRRPRIAIVLDDWGYNMKNLQSALALDCPITFSILPELPYSQRIAKAAYEDGNEVILHLPLEPYEDLDLEKDTIMTSMGDKEAEAMLDKLLASVPDIKGVSNHMGSRATEDERIMSVVMKKLKRKGYYYLDSVVTARSICRDVSVAAGTRFAARSVFLDNELSTDYIKGKIEKLAEEAIATGSAIGVGHDRAVTLAALEEMVPWLKERGIEIVPASELAK